MNNMMQMQGMHGQKTQYPNMPLPKFLMNMISKLDKNKLPTMRFTPNKAKSAQKSLTSETEKSKKPMMLLKKLINQRALVKAKRLETKKTPE
jgi:hypothetical protein